MASPTKITWNRRNARDAKLAQKRNKRTNKATAQKNAAAKA